MHFLIIMIIPLLGGDRGLWGPRTKELTAGVELIGSRYLAYFKASGELLYFPLRYWVDVSCLGGGVGFPCDLDCPFRSPCRCRLDADEDV